MVSVQDILNHFVSNDWHSFEAASPVASSDGALIEGAVMRRSLNGIVEYRPMTEDELVVFEDSFRFHG